MVHNTHFTWESTSELAHLLIEKVQIFPVKYGVRSLVSAQIQLFSGSNCWFGEGPDFLLLQQMEVSWNRATPTLSPFFSDFPLKKPSIWDALAPPVSIQASPSPKTSWPARTSRHRRAPRWRSKSPGRGGKRPGAPGAAALIHGKWICPIDSNRIFQHLE